jgi:hypothetical protein
LEHERREINEIHESVWEEYFITPSTRRGNKIKNESRH